MNKLEQATSKLQRLESEMKDTYERSKEELDKIPFGQPNIVGRKDIYKQVKHLHAKAINLSDQVDKQKNRISKLEKVKQFKEDNEKVKDIHVVGKSRYATVGAKTSVNNLEHFKQKLEELEELNRLAKEHNKEVRKNGGRKWQTYGTKITELKYKISMLESIQEQAEENEHLISEKAQALIRSGKVTQWTKKPIYYFVKGLKRVALELKDGEFIISRRYPAVLESDKEYVYSLLND